MTDPVIDDESVTAREDWRSAERLVHALQFEGYLLYPYRASALKNQQRWTFGTLYPPVVAPQLSERSSASFEVLLRAPEPDLFISIRVLRAQRSELAAHSIPAKLRGARKYHRTFRLSLADQHHCEGIDGELTVSSEALDRDVYRVRLELKNRTAWTNVDRAQSYEVALVAAHLIVHAAQGQFIPPYYPPPELAQHAASLVHDGLYPVLIGDAHEPRTLVSSPIIVEDFPKIAPESTGDFYDLTEIDELLALRVLTLSSAEKAEILRGDRRGRSVLERTERLTEDELFGLHGRTTTTPVGDSGRPSGCRFALGDRVRIAPRPGGDVLDIALSGEAATVCAIEQDLEGRWYVAVTIDADPGVDLGRQGLPGHRFFFSTEELEPAR